MEQKELLQNQISLKEAAEKKRLEMEKQKEERKKKFAESIQRLGGSVDAAFLNKVYAYGKSLRLSDQQALTVAFLSNLLQLDPTVSDFYIRVEGEYIVPMLGYRGMLKLLNQERLLMEPIQYQHVFWGETFDYLELKVEENFDIPRRYENLRGILIWCRIKINDLDYLIKDFVKKEQIEERRLTNVKRIARTIAIETSQLYDQNVVGAWNEDPLTMALIKALRIFFKRIFVMCPTSRIALVDSFMNRPILVNESGEISFKEEN
jgi:hypothetical protein